MIKIFKYSFVILFLLIFRLTFAQLPDIIALEYYFDTDPGFGNGTEVTFSADSLVDVTFDADLSGLSNGFHMLYVRAMDESGNWSFVFTESVLSPFNPPVASSPFVLPQIVEMEYFFDLDPGIGNGSEITITADSLINKSFNVDLSGITTGFHIVYIRVKDEVGKWSIEFANAILKFPDPIAVATPETLSQIVAMEYFFDADPGFGNGIPLPIATDSIVEVVFDADFSQLDNGVHNFYVRVKDEDGKWTLLYSEAIFIFSPPIAGSPEILQDVVAMEYFFDNDPGFGNGTEIMNAPDSVIVENFFADIAMLGGGTHILYTRVKDGNNKWSQVATTPFCIQGIQLYLEGPYKTSTGFMSTDLIEAGLLPLSQPFGSNTNAEWFYNGTESVASIPNTNIVDWLLLQARDATSPENATSASVKESQVAFLLNNGEIVGLDGESNISFSEPITNELYLVVFQRNHLGVMSSYPLETTGDCSCSYNFTIRPEQVYGAENSYKEIKDNVWGLISGDGNGNGQVSLQDKTDVWMSESGNAGYLSGDFNMDGQSDNNDKNDQWKINNGKTGQVPD